MTEQKTQTTSTPKAADEVVRPGYSDRNLPDPYDPDNPEGPVGELSAAPGHETAKPAATLPQSKKPDTEVPVSKAK